MSKSLVIAENHIALDKDGYLLDLDDWTQEVATALAEREGINLEKAHWDVIELLREFYAEHGLSPMMRILVKQMKIRFGDDKGNSIYLMSLFPEYPALIASKIAGLPRPTNCP